MLFIIEQMYEIIDDNPTSYHDFSVELMKSVQFYRWRDRDFNKDYFLHHGKFNGQKKDCIPCGSVDFVQAYMRYAGIPIPKPLNIPPELMDRKYTGRKVWIQDEKVEPGLFAKSHDVVKGFAGIVEPDTVLLPGQYQVSEVVDFVSEWRAFVFNGDVVGLQCYSGDFFEHPCKYSIIEMVKQFKNCPPAYTLDVGNIQLRDFDGHLVQTTRVIEAHDFYSVGLYGFTRHDILCYMFSQWWNWHKRRSGL